jgi:hypothetical protein
MQKEERMEKKKKDEGGSNSRRAPRAPAEQDDRTDDDSMATPLKTGLERVRHGDPEPAPCASEEGRSGTRNEHGKRK